MCALTINEKPFEAIGRPTRRVLLPSRCTHVCFLYVRQKRVNNIAVTDWLFSKVDSSGYTTKEADMMNPIY